MFENIMNFFKRSSKKEGRIDNHSKTAAKERLHLVLMQDRANVSADFLELMKQEIIEVIKKYIDVDESAIDVRLTNKENADGTNGAPALYANIPILNIKNEARKMEASKKEEKEEKTDKVESKKIEENKDEDKNKEEVKKEDKEEIKEESDEKENEEKTSEQKEENLEENSSNETEKVEDNTNNIEQNEEKETKSKEKIKSKNK